ncbi:hypothetical protein AAEX28_06205 [Lentisphaerota bacterium WC36G]|nr:hypothetical protein LJT99_09065 [Lentisphaerae bacterium WC36]
MIITLTIAIILACVTILLVGGIPIEGKFAEAVYHSPVLITLSLLVVLLIIIGSIVFITKKYSKRSLAYNISFLLMHYGIAIGLIGAAVSYFKAEKVSFAAFLDSSLMVKDLPPQYTGLNKMYNLPFFIKAQNFSVEHYAPKYYTLWGYNEKSTQFEITKSEKHPEGKYYIKDLSNKKTETFGKFKEIPLTRLKKGENSWKHRIYLDDDNVLEANNTQAKKFRCEIMFAPNDGKTVNNYGVINNLNKTITKELIINHPASYDGWRIFLMGYDRRQEYEENGTVRYVSLTARRDPGRIPVHIGIWALIVGTFLWAFAPKPKKKIA